MMRRRYGALLGILAAVVVVALVALPRAVDAEPQPGVGAEIGGEEGGGAAVTPEPAGHWAFDDTSDPTRAANDGSFGSPWDGAIEGDGTASVSLGETTDPGFGHVLHFDAPSTSTAYGLKIAASSGDHVFRATGDFTFTLWIKSADTSACVVLQQADPGRTIINREGDGSFFTFLDGKKTTLTDPVPAGSWHMLTLVKHGDAVTGYVDGVKSHEGTLDASVADSPTDLLVGRHKNAVSNSAPFVGDVDELSYYEAPLGDDDVKALYDAQESVISADAVPALKRKVQGLVDEARKIEDSEGFDDKGDETAQALASAADEGERALQSEDATVLQAAADGLSKAIDAYRAAAPLLVDVDPSKETRRLSRGIFGINHRFGYNGYGSFDDQAGKVKDDFSALYEQAGFGSIRYPGGTISNLFAWKQSIGDTSQRTKEIHGIFNSAGQTGLEPAFGVDEAAAFAEQENSELVYVYGLGRGDANDAADLVEYLDAAQGTNPNGGIAWADVRAQNGHPEPYGVRYFEIGNEMEMGGTDGQGSQQYWTASVEGGALEGYTNGGTATFQQQYAVRKDDWNEAVSYSDGTQNQVFYARYALLPREQQAPGYDTFTALDQGSVHVYVAGEEWQLVDDLSQASKSDKVVQVDYKTGSLHFGDGVHGAIPEQGRQVTVSYSVHRDGFVQVAQKMRDTMRQINEDNERAGRDLEQINLYASFQSADFVNKMHDEGRDDLYDGLTIHPYARSGIDTSSDEGRESYYWDALGKTDDNARLVEGYVQLMQKYDPTKVPVISEYGLINTSSLVRSQTGALYSARALMDYVRLGSPYILRHCLVDWYSNGGDSLGPSQQAVIQAVPQDGASTKTGEGDFAFFSTPSARMFEILDHNYGTTALDSSVPDDPTLNGGVSQLAVMASRDDEGNVYVAIVNAALDGERDAAVRLAGVDASGKSVTVTSASGDSFSAENDLDHPDAVSVQTSGQTAGGASVRVRLQPHSFTVVKIAGALSPEKSVDVGRLAALVGSYKGLERGDADEGAWNAFVAALSSAKGALGSSDQQEVDAAADGLVRAAAELRPSQPETGGQPETPARPETGAKPETGTKPETPARPETGTEPETGGQPETPARPETGTEPETGGQPETPARPETGRQPDDQQQTTPIAGTTPDDGSGRGGNSGSSGSGSELPQTSDTASRAGMLVVMTVGVTIVSSGAIIRLLRARRP